MKDEIDEPLRRREEERRKREELLGSRGAYPDEGVDVGGLVAAREAALVALAVGRDVLRVPLPQLLDRLLDHLVAAGLPHRLGAVVGVGAGAVPVTLPTQAHSTMSVIRIRSS